MSPLQPATHHQQVQSSQNPVTVTYSRRHCQHTRRGICRHTNTHRRVCVCLCISTFGVCVYTCMIELAAKTKQVKQRKAENVCECGRICKGITAGIISMIVEGHKQTHKHNTYTKPQGPCFYCPQSDRAPYVKHIRPLTNYICTQGEKQTALQFLVVFFLFFTTDQSIL